ncbi:hypothetical protein HIM_00269 [Hirsutella minnesotensis 3608]|nr:hypothetical protein HIM_00269 [Hirsutella minnesotensis 3608]
MKYALVFAGTAALVGALPQQAPQASGKLPWLQPGQKASECGKPNYEEAVCGTEEYCQAIDIADSRNKLETVLKNQWKTTYDCFRAHQPDPKPVRFENKLPEPDCSFRGYWESTCGTMEYCRTIDLVGPASKELLFNRWESTAECLASHEKLPWVEADSPGCGTRGYTEKRCGTEEYCKSFDNKDLFGTQLGNDARYNSAEECFSVHVKKPAPAPANEAPKAESEDRWPWNTPEWRKWTAEGPQSPQHASKPEEHKASKAESEDRWPWNTPEWREWAAEGTQSPQHASKPEEHKAPKQSKSHDKALPDPGPINNRPAFD